MESDCKKDTTIYFRKGRKIQKMTITVNALYELVRDDGLLLIFTSKLGIISLKQHRRHTGNSRR